MTSRTKSVDGRHAFLEGLIDDAGLFPPASLSMQAAAREHEAASKGPNRWMLNRFVCPATRLSELAAVLPTIEIGRPWDLSVILDGVTARSWDDAIEKDLDAVRRFSGQVGPVAVVRLVEVPLPDLTGPETDRPTAEDLIRGVTDAIADSRVPGPITPFVEVPQIWDVDASLRAIAAVRESREAGGTCAPPGAKIRCGGATAEAVPSIARVARFVARCEELHIPFKATAGLHHPYRHVDRATGFLQHGFLNVVGAAVMAQAHGLEEETLSKLLADDQPDHFSLIPQGFGWQDLWADPTAIAAARRDLFVSYGSCSFDEPLEDLTALGILPVEAE
jgi:hypothetical protein